VWLTGSYFDPVRSVGIKVLNSKLSEYVRLAASGETVLVADHDRRMVTLAAAMSIPLVELG
jgi:antitoxin (DNA-binding transcriptional repressor) of toxin-antitoxin stability system